MKGRIKNIMTTYGFIRSGNQDYFFHRDSFHGYWDDLAADYKHNTEIPVEFEPENSPKGPRATEVRRLDHPNQHS